jgi:homoserine kinase type II
MLGKYEMELMNPSNVLTAWQVPGPWQFSPLAGGSTTNQALRVDAADGQSYVLRLSPDPTRVPFIQYEAAILQALSEKELPFRLPLPLKTKSGDIVILVEPDTGRPACATLYPFLPGSLPEHDLPHASYAGLALAQLDEALATAPAIQQPDDVMLFPPFGELTLCHPLVPDPLAAADWLVQDRERASNVCALLAAVMESIPSLYRELPQQFVHRDCGPGNILIDHGHVTAILDFEFMGKDLRVLDLCVALSWWPLKLLKTGKEWDIIDAVGTAYMHHLPLGENELLAIPDVWRLRLANIFVYSMGYYLAEPNSGIDIEDQAKRLLWTNTWLSAHRETLLSHVLAWN